MGFWLSCAVCALWLMVVATGYSLNQHQPYEDRNKTQQPKIEQEASHSSEEGGGPSASSSSVQSSRPQPRSNKWACQQDGNPAIRVLCLFDEHNGSFSALAAIAVAVFTFFLWRLTRRQLVAAENAALAAQEGARAAAETVSHMKDTAKRELRAYLSYEEGSIINFTGDQPRVQIRIANSGQTPAYKIAARVVIAFLKWPLENPAPAFPLSDEIEQRSGPCGPRSHFILSRVLTDPPLPANRMSLLARKDAALFVYGEVRYEDVFGDPHSVKFRLAHGGQTEVHPLGNLATCEEGNDAD